MAVDVSGFVYFAPILAFLIVFVIMFAILHKLGKNFIGENMFVQIFVSFLVATVFVTATSVRQLVLNVLPWFAVLLIALFLILLLVGFMGKTDAIMTKGFGWVFVVLLIIVFLVSAVKVFAGGLGPYLPWASTSDIQDADPATVRFFSWLYSPPVAGFILLIVVGAVVSWILTRKAK